MNTDGVRQAPCHWADQTAEKIIRERGDLPLYTCASGITPSGTVHIGNFREIISVDLVVRALRERGKSVRFIYSWDDYDVFRKVPLNMPDQQKLESYLRFPIILVPDPYGRDASYARHHEVDVETVLDKVGIHPEYLYQAERYRSNVYAEGMRQALQKREAIKDCLNRFRDEAHKMPADEEYWPVSLFCSSCNRDTTEITGYDGEYALSYRCTSCGFSETADLRTTKGAKLGWRVDWPMRWQREGVVFEPAGKDHHSQGGSFDTARLIAREIYHFEAPVSFRYDFISIKGSPGKMSSSKGEVISLHDVLKVYQPELARYLFAGTRPNTEFAISFDLDVIKTYEDYDRCERIAWGVDKAKNEQAYAKERRIYELSQIEGMPETMPYQAGFRHLCNMLQTNGGNIEAVIAALGGVKAEQLETLRTRCRCAWYWIRECAPEDFRFELRLDGSQAELSETERAAVIRVRDEILPRLDALDEKPLSQELYAVAEGVALEPKTLFSALYRVLISREQGPRLAGFMKILGKERLDRILSVY